MRRIKGLTVLTELAEIVDPKHTALVIVDMQRDFCSRDGWFARRGFDVSQIELALGNLITLLRDAREAGVLPVYIQMEVLPDFRSLSGSNLRFQVEKVGFLDYSGEDFYTLPGSRGVEFVPEIAPRKGDIVVRKWRSSGFRGTNLDMILRCNGIQSVVCTGVASYACVNSTAHDATFHDYYTVVAEDCVAGYDRALHDAALKLQAYRMDVVGSAAIREVWRRHRAPSMRLSAQ